MRFRFISLAALASSWMAASACSTPTTVSDVWRDPSYTSAPMRRLFVVGAMSTASNRRVLEDDLVSMLAQHSVAATASYRVFPDHPEGQTVKRYVQAHPYDGALVVTLRSVHTRKTTEPGGDLGWYYGWGGGIDYPVETARIVKVETSLWDARTAKLVWSAVTETENPSSSSDAIHSLVDELSSAMTKEGLIPGPRPVAHREHVGATTL